MFMPFAFLLLLLTVPLAGGRLSRLACLRVRGIWLALGALVLQIVMTSGVDAPHAVFVGMHAVSYAMVAWALWLNRAVPGLLLIALGGATNAVVIALNGGTLPARAAALAEAGFAVDPERSRTAACVDDPVLPWLGDIVATPAFLPFRNVISIGDLVDPARRRGAAARDLPQPAGPPARAGARPGAGVRRAAAGRRLGQRGEPRGGRGDALVGSGEREADVRGAGRPVELARGHEHADVGQRAPRCPSSGSPRVHHR